jgi:hypothetical protein
LAVHQITGSGVSVASSGASIKLLERLDGDGMIFAERAGRG